MLIQGQVRLRCPDRVSDLTMIQVDLILMDDYPADSYAISPAAFLFNLNCTTRKSSSADAHTRSELLFFGF